MKTKCTCMSVFLGVLLCSAVQPAVAAEIAPDFSMAGTWSAQYQSKKITIELKNNHKGTLTIGGLKPVTLLKWEVEQGKKGKVTLGLYFYSRDKKRFAKRTLRMYNAGRGFKLKAIYKNANQLKLYNVLLVKEGKIMHDDGQMSLKR